MLRTLRKCTWEEIEVGKVFAWKDAEDWTILIKDDEGGALQLATGAACFLNLDSLYRWRKNTLIHLIHLPLYKLPKSVQRLWITEK